MKVGVLAVQGNFREHAAVLRRLGTDEGPVGGTCAGMDDERVHALFLESVRERSVVRA